VGTGKEEPLSTVNTDAVEHSSIVRPTLTLLDEGQVEQVHAHSLQILSSAGVRVDSERARQLFARALGPGAIQDDRVYIPRQLVEWALVSSTNAVDIYDGEGAQAFRLPDRARFGIGVTALYYQDPETDAVVPFARRHMETMVRLGSELPSFDLISTVGIVQDVPPEVLDLYATLDMVANTSKPLVILVSDEEAFPAVLDLLEHLRGDLAQRPSVIPYFNPITPLVINRGTVDKMWAAIQRGIPFIYSSYGMAGASTPITPAGTLALLNAELLAGLTLSQLIKEGTPLILGSLPAYFDMKGKGSYYRTPSYLLDLACAEMMVHYGLPHAGTSGAGMGWGVDLIAGGHQWFNHLISCLGKVGLVPFVGDNLGSMAFCPAITVYANEVIRQARLFARGFVLDEDAVSAGEIAQVGPGGNFLMSESTLRLFREVGAVSDVFPTLTLEAWLAQDSPRAGDLLRGRTRELIDSLEAPEGHGDLLERGEAFIRGLEAKR
jgi:trimethylamine--corrinoid protein Co-methyltransferase